MQKRRTGLEGAAYHEAGHAVAAWYFERPIERAFITEADESGGLVAAWPRDEVLSEEEAKNKIVFIRAGLVAQTMFAPDTIRKTTGPQVHQGFGDNLKISELLERIAPDDAETQGKIWHELYATTERRLAGDDMKRAIEAIAGDLIRHREITGRKVAELIGGGVKAPSRACPK